MIWIRSVVLLFTAAAMACAPPASSGKSRNANVLTAEEIAGSQATTAYEAVQSLRPNFLRTRGSHTFDPTAVQAPHVFLDGQKFGELEILRSISVQTIREIRYYNAADATTKYGTGYTHGIIEVSTR